MDIFMILLVSAIAFLIGIALTLLVEFYLFKKYIETALEAPPIPNPPIPGKAELPEELLTKLKEGKIFGSSSPLLGVIQGNENLAINLTLQFLFNELRNAERVRLWIYRKLNNEFKELLTHTTTGKLFDSVQLRTLNLGNHFPTINSLEVADAKICADTGLLETLDLCLDLHYTGNFEMSIDVRLLLGKSAYLALQVKQVTGKARLQFTRVPYTHWSLSFYSEPILELEAQSQFQGRQLQPQIISLITGQIRRAIRRKHTLPRYKMRYKPFFRRLNDEVIDLSEIGPLRVTPGKLEVTLLEVNRLNLDAVTVNGEDTPESDVYCTLSIDSIPWVYLTHYNGVPYMVVDLIISKISSQQLGVVFKQETLPEVGQTCVLVETIIAGSPAAIAEMKRGDIIVAVNSKKVTNMNQVAKLMKSSAQRRFIIRVERKLSKYDLEKAKMDADKGSVSEKSSDRSKGESVNLEEGFKPKFDTQIKFSDLRDLDNDSSEKLESSSRLFRRRKSSILLAEEAQMPDTPSRRISNSGSNMSNLSNSLQSYVTDDGSTISISDLYYATSDRTHASRIAFNEVRNFQIESELQYLNIGVWARAKNNESQPKLVGYLNVPVKLILAQCSTFSTGHYLKCHALLPPDTATPGATASKLQGYSGFDPTLCYGDILLSYVWTSNRPNLQSTTDNMKKNAGENLKVQPNVGGDNNRKVHDFIRTHFHRATHCDFCSKKIWLKDAVQCRDCGMVCHKKCEIRCQASGACGAESLNTLVYEADEVDPNTIVGENGPEISFTACEENVQGASMMAMRASIANTLLGLKKAGSTSCLAPPNAGTGPASRSLPPSPCASRKSSLIGGLGISPDLLEGAEPSVAASIIAGDLDDGLMSKAKDTGRFLYDNLEPQERVERINSMITKLKTALDIETTSRVELSQSSDAECSRLIAQSDLKVQALSVLLLHYCTGLQHAQETIDRPKGSGSSRPNTRCDFNE